MQTELVPGELARRRRLDQHEVPWRVIVRLRRPLLTREERRPLIMRSCGGVWNRTVNERPDKQGQIAKLRRSLTG